MDREKKFLLFILLALFAIVTGLLIWSFVYDYQTRFLAGTDPTAPQTQTPAPSLPPVRASDPVAGSVDPQAVTIVEFADFSCLYCRITQAELSKALSVARTPVRLVWRDLPLAPDRPEGLTASLAGRCAQEQGKFWEMHDALFSAKDLKEATITQAARVIVPNLDAFSRCFQSGKYLQDIRDDIQLARRSHIVSTPTLFIGKEVVSGYISSAELQSIIQQQRQP